MSKAINKTFFFMCMLLILPTLCLEKYIKMSTPTDAFALAIPYLPKNPVILEAGAYDGEESAMMMRLWPQGTLHTFEPVPELYHKLVKKLRPYPNAFTYPFALSDEKGMVPFHLSSYEWDPNTVSQSSSLIRPKEHLTHAPEVLFRKSIDVFTTTIDAWAQDYAIDHIDFMWLDMQGSELYALKAAPRIIKTVKAILTEVECIEAYEGQPLFNEVKRWLETEGFTMIATTLDLQNANWFGDALFVRI